jgi:hypothetical protein
VAFAHPKTITTFNDPKVAVLLNSLGLDPNTPGVMTRYLEKLREVDNHLRKVTAPQFLVP